MASPNATSSAPPTTIPSTSKFPHPLSIPSSLPSSTSSSPPQPHPPPHPPPECSPHYHSRPHSDTISTTAPASVPALASIPKPSTTTPPSSLTPSPTAQSLDHPIYGNGLTVDDIFVRAERVFEQRVDTLLHAKRCKALQSGTAFNARKAKRDARTVAGREKLDALVRRLADLAAAQHKLLSNNAQKVVSGALDGAAAAIIGLAALLAVPSPSSSAASPPVPDQQYHHHHHPPLTHQQQDVVADGSSCSDDSVNGPGLPQVQVFGSSSRLDNSRFGHNTQNMGLPNTNHHNMFPATQSVVDFVFDCEVAERSDNARLGQGPHPFPLMASEETIGTFTNNDDIIVNTATVPQVQLGFGLGIDSYKQTASNPICEDRSCTDNTCKPNTAKRFFYENGNNCQPMSSGNFVATTQFMGSSPPPPSNSSSSSLCSLGSASSASASSSCASLATACLSTVMGSAHPNSTTARNSAVNPITPNSTIASYNMTSFQPMRGGHVQDAPNLACSSLVDTGGPLVGNFNSNPQKRHIHGRTSRKPIEENIRNKLGYSSSSHQTCNENHGRYRYGEHFSPSTSPSTLKLNSAGSYESGNHKLVSTINGPALEGHTKNSGRNVFVDRDSNNLETHFRSSNSSSVFIDQYGDRQKFGSSFNGYSKSSDGIVPENLICTTYDALSSKGGGPRNGTVQQQQQQRHIAHTSFRSVADGMNINGGNSKLEIREVPGSHNYSISGSNQVHTSSIIWNSQPSAM